MKLEIDLADREEIAAAVPLLQLILDNAPKTCGGQCSRTVTHSVGDMTVTETISGDPAVIFGGAQVPDPLALAGAPCIAGAVPSPIVPGAMPGITSIPDASALVPPAPIAPATGAPTGSAAAPTIPAPAVELDAKGLPWDERIHAGSKGKLKDGTWRAKKEVDSALVAAVETELRAKLAASWPAGAHGGVMVPAGVASGEIPVSPDLQARLASEVPPAPVDPTTFEQLMPRITAACTAGSLPPTAIGAACAAHGLNSVVALQSAPQFVPLVWATLKQQYPALA